MFELMVAEAHIADIRREVEAARRAYDVARMLRATPSSRPNVREFKLGPLVIAWR